MVEGCVCRVVDGWGREVEKKKGKPESILYSTPLHPPSSFVPKTGDGHNRVYVVCMSFHLHIVHLHRVQSRRDMAMMTNRTHSTTHVLQSQRTA